jgi:SAM-dependent methyltransferase
MTAPRGHYDAIPYLSKPFPKSQPPRLAALATLFGLTAPAVSQCRMLELGCAAGGNIIPLALRFPGGRFRGVDLVERHVRDGQARIAALDLRNVCIEQGDIAALDLLGERFDYIVCHGVYSYVPPAVQEAILRIASDNLADTGIAYISYNVYPGWHIRNFTRDMLLYHAGAETDPRERVAKARMLLDGIANSRAGGPYGETRRNEAKVLLDTDDSYIMSEFLEGQNLPCYFREFAAKAEGFGLAYLCDTLLQHSIPEHLGDPAAIEALSAGDPIALEQWMDFFSARSFRQTLLVKAAQAAKIKRTLLPERVKDLHVSGQFTCTEKGKGTWVLSAENGASISTRNEVVCRAIQKLSTVFPATRSVRELAAEVRAGDQERLLLDFVFKMILAGLVDISSVPLRINKVGASKPKPRARRLPRLDAEQGNAWTTDPALNLVPLDAVCATLLPFLDGAHDRDALKTKLLAAVRDGRLRLKNKTTGLEPTGADLDAAADAHVGAVIGKLAAAAILE